ncbi:MAG: ribosome recycling factor [Candidatus Paracaedimonas acanthamoebae]|uniref:Ribosome-recycling factor n=1 Tax=Candidatus Paracaedimonas acanthamoebae TaxID=244581 RepID=A0A8J7PW17_9PROT|nr:ribosome recycling factor [Candidatus Paracaedimonas acanthamoebae]
MNVFNLDDLNKRMQGAMDALIKEFNGLRTNRASTHLLEPLMIDAYGSRMPMTQVGTISTPEARLLTVQVWDKELVKAVEKAIREAGLGLNPSADGQMVRIPMPDLSLERRQELTKIAAKYAEQGKIAVRAVRRDGMDELKKLEKESKISEDDHHNFSDEIQKLTDDFIKKIDQALHQKEKDILQV